MFELVLLLGVGMELSMVLVVGLMWLICVLVIWYRWVLLNVVLVL